MNHSNKETGMDQSEFGLQSNVSELIGYCYWLLVINIDDTDTQLIQSGSGHHPAIRQNNLTN